jgi:hypothetical protein
VVTLSASGSTDYHFLVEPKPNGSTTVRFGDGVPIQTLAPSLGVEVHPVNVRAAEEIEGAVAAFARTSK